MKMAWMAGAFIGITALAGCRSSQEIAAADDNTCRSYGAVPGSDVYVQCRVAQGQRRDAARIARNRDADLGIAAGVALATGAPIR